jgi:hypothetical protein
VETTKQTIVKLERTTDREKPCCGNLATIQPGKGPHGAELRCIGCGKHRGWFPKQVLGFLKEVTDRFGDSPEPIILRDQTFGDQPLKKFDDSNRGALFKNNRKDGDASPDYRGEINVGGVEHWINGWIKQSKKGEKYMSLSVRAKDYEGE